MSLFALQKGEKMAQTSEVEEFWQGQEVQALPQAGSAGGFVFPGARAVPGLCRRGRKPATAQGVYFAFVLLKTYVLPLSMEMFI